MFVRERERQKERKKERESERKRERVSERRKRERLPKGRKKCVSENETPFPGNEA